MCVISQKNHIFIYIHSYASGVCACAEGWNGEQCDVDASTNPVVLPADETCDILTSTSSCEIVGIAGDNFVPTNTLSCVYYFAQVRTVVYYHQLFVHVCFFYITVELVYNGTLFIFLLYVTTVYKILIYFYNREIVICL